MRDKLRSLSVKAGDFIRQNTGPSSHANAYVRKLFDPAISLRKRVLYGISGLAGLWLVCLSLYALILIPFTPGISDLRKSKSEEPSVLLSADGKELMRYKRLNREWIKLERISSSVVDALIATEDHRFYEHHGIDLKRTASSVVYTILGDTQGGSTITQQLARNMYPDEIGRSATLTRKLKEMITALKIEYAYSKKEILETYLNTVPFLYNAYGIEMASRTYFDKSASNLNLLESATLVGMLKGTSYYNPVRNPKRSVSRRNVVLSQMVKHGKLDQAKFDALKKRPLRLDFERQLEQIGPSPHFAEHVRKWLVDWADRNDYNIYADGLVVHSTIDFRLQKLANQAVTKQMDALQAVADVEWGLPSGKLLSTSMGAYAYSKRRVQPFSYFWKSNPQLMDAFIRETSEFRVALDGGASEAETLARLRDNTEFLATLQARKSRLEAGFVAIDPDTGFVKAWVGSRDFGLDKFDHVAQAKRQPGSTFKPIVYGAALEKGLSPRRRYEDRQVEIPLPDGSVWRPTDSERPTGRSMTMEEGLIYSKNNITAQVMQEVGPKEVARLAKNMGVSESAIDAVPSLALGTSPVSLVEMVSSYATIASLGAYRKPLVITRITDKAGNILAEFAPEVDQALDRENAVVLVDMMRGVVDHGTGLGIRNVFGVRADVAGKTGTTQNNTDGWFILMHPQLVGGAWVGFNDPRVTIRSNYWGQGAHNALYVVGDFYRQALNSGAISGKLAFPRRPSTSIFAPIIDRFHEWFDRQRGVESPEPEKKEIAPPPEREPPPEKDFNLDEVDRVIDQVKETGDVINDQIDRFERLRRDVERGLGGG